MKTKSEYISAWLAKRPMFWFAWMARYPECWEHYCKNQTRPPQGAVLVSRKPAITSRE